MKRGLHFFLYFQIISVSAIILILVVAILGVRFILRDFVLREAELDATRIAKAIHNSDMGLFVRTNIDDERLVGILKGQMSEIDRRIRILIEPFDIIDIKVYDSAGRAIYSIEPETVGTLDLRDAPLQAALSGSTNSRYRYEKEVLDILGQVRKDVEIVETYVPVRGQGGRIVGCFNLRKDVTSDIGDARVLGIGGVAILAITALGAFAILMYVIRRGEQKINAGAAILQQSEEKIQHSHDVQTMLNSLLSLSLEDLTLEEMLARSIDYITDIPWLALESKGSIFLVEEESETLVMKAQKGLPRPLRAMCDNVPLGECVCGRTAASGEVTFTNCLYKRHDRTYEGISEHGHYCVPIISGEKVIGVINAYVEKGHQRRDMEEDFLVAASAVVAGIVERKRAEDALAGLNEDLESAVRVLSGITKVLIPRGSVFKGHDAE